jgi:prepilin-type N-terminal cleavage/methylation domain-containing protein
MEFEPSGEERMRQAEDRGFSLMEVLVAMMILGIAFSTLFGLISGSLRNVDRIQEHDKIVRFGQMKVNELVLQINQGVSPQQFQLSGSFDEKYRWQASMEPFSALESPNGTPGYSLVRLHLSVIWIGRSGENQFKLETVTWFPIPKDT